GGNGCRKSGNRARSGCPVPRLRAALDLRKSGCEPTFRNRSRRKAMLDRQKLEAILVRRFPGASIGQVAAAANAIMGLGEEWEEIVEAPTCTAARSRD